MDENTNMFKIRYNFGKSHQKTPSLFVHESKKDGILVASFSFFFRLNQSSLWSYMDIYFLCHLGHAPCYAWDKIPGDAFYVAVPTHLDA